MFISIEASGFCEEYWRKIEIKQMVKVFWFHLEAVKAKALCFIANVAARCHSEIAWNKLIVHDVAPSLGGIMYYEILRCTRLISALWNSRAKWSKTAWFKCRWWSGSMYFPLKVSRTFFDLQHSQERGAKFDYLLSKAHYFRGLSWPPWGSWKSCHSFNLL